MNLISLSVWDIAAVAVFVLLNGVLSLWLSLGIERQIPLFGMILGNAMTGISLGLDTLTTAAVRVRSAIEARISLWRGALRCPAAGYSGGVEEPWTRGVVNPVAPALV